MDKHIVSETPNPSQWLELDETERLDLVTEFVSKYEKSLERAAIPAHASAHVIVENRLAMGAEPTRKRMPDYGSKD